MMQLFIYIVFLFFFQRGNLKKALNYSQKMVELGIVFIV